MRSLPSRSVAIAAIAGLALFVAPPSHGGPGAGGGSAAAGPGKLIHLKVGDFDPLVAMPDVPEGLSFVTEPASGIFVVQFDRPIDPSLLSTLETTGAEAIGYLPDEAYLVRLPAGAASAVRRLADVRWLGAVQPGWKIAPDFGTRPFDDPTRRLDGKYYATVDLFDGENPDALEALVTATGVEFIQHLRFGGKSRFKVRGTMPQIEAIAGIDGVSWIEETGEVTKRNNTTRWVIQTNVSGSTTLWDKGLHGENQIIGHIDGRIDMDSCYFEDTTNNTPGPGHRKVIAYRANRGLGKDSHGTHTAGTSAGDQIPINGTDANNGHAYMAKIAHGDLDDVTGSGTQASNLYQFLAQAHGDGARLHTNSWGDDGTTSYTTWCVDIDQFSYDFEDSLVLFAETNGGALRTPENAKNVLAVGASNNGSGAANHCSGGVGPTSDGRRKPEIYAPGCSIVSARNNSACSTSSSTGTSMACPAVTAAGTLARQYYTEGFYPSGLANAADALTPSGALLKATLLNSTVDMTGVSGYPSNLEGWGRVLLENALYFDGDVRRLSVIDDVRNAVGFTTGEATSYPLVVEDSLEPLKITLVWTEPAAALLAANASINDLDLEVRSPSGTLYLGNNIDSGSGQSLPGGSTDTINNVEMVILNTPEIGEWTVTVRGAAVNQGTQGFAAVASGQVAPTVTGGLRHDSHVIDDSAPLGNGNGIMEPGETITMPVTLFNADDTAATSVSATALSNQQTNVKVTTGTATYPNINPDATGGSNAPHYRYTVQPAAGCGDVVRFDISASSSNGASDTSFAVPIGSARLDANGTGLPVTIPTLTSPFISESVVVNESFTIKDVHLFIDIAHGDIGELGVALEGPDGTRPNLHNGSSSGTADLVATYDRDTPSDGPGSMSDFDGKSAQGTWQLLVRDTVDSGVPSGSLRDWRIEFTATTAVDCTPLSCGDPVPGEVPLNMTAEGENGNDLRLDWSAVSGADTYRVWRSESPDFAQEELVTSTTDTTHLIVDAFTNSVTRYYRVRAANSCEWEGP